MKTRWKGHGKRAGEPRSGNGHGFDVVQKGHKEDGKAREKEKIMKSSVVKTLAFVVLANIALATSSFASAGPVFPKQISIIPKSFSATNGVVKPGQRITFEYKVAGPIQGLLRNGGYFYDSKGNKTFLHDGCEPVYVNLKKGQSTSFTATFTVPKLNVGTRYWLWEKVFWTNGYWYFSLAQVTGFDVTAQ